MVSNYFSSRISDFSIGIIDNNLASAPRISAESNGGSKNNIADIKPQFQQQEDDEDYEN